MSVIAGSCIIEALPFVHCLLYDKKQLFCDFCFKESSRCLRCSRCKFMHYCSKQCQINDWSIHEHECKKFSKIEENNKLKEEIKDDLNCIFLRTLIQVKINNKNNFTDNYGLKSFETLMDHYDDLVKDMDRLAKMQKCFCFIRDLMGEDFLLKNKLNAREMISIFGKLMVNTITIGNFDLSEMIGSGIYLSVSSIDHSCEPNSVVTFNGFKIFVKAIRKLESEEKYSISYIDILMPKKFRQQTLLKNYYFLCKCDRCLFKNEIVS
ncbi:histone-lysine N-methyltransferase SMYD3 [Brachionus plicatilis]|uniref:Histone-lysine N-methyltransferase SMYD3 n=1 Tax=Brachionus plicatilis TaxID=10195 RepID=A0A3M7Q409_BRAPC|nr:histone-lysine N-methyltransferase SMYD3 [Brachionus plicatilis]